MRKIGIITITRGENYGNKLQNYAVQEVLKKLGNEAETIKNTTKKGFETPILASSTKYTIKHIFRAVKVRFKNRFFIKNNRDSSLKSIFWVLKNKESILRVKKERQLAFKKFSKKYIDESDFTIERNQIPKDKINQYDFFTCGSDQVWNPFYPQTSGIDFLDFTSQKKRIAYAPSFGVSFIPNSRKEIYREWLKAIPNLSVREEQGAVIIKELTGRDAEVLVDPTLMLNEKEWLDIAKKPDIEISEKYILTYFLGNQTRESNDFVNKVAKEQACSIINLNDIHETKSYKVDPSGFLYLIKNAFLICTDSFHGMVLSIILKKEFIAFDRVEEGNSMGSRVTTLLNKFDLKSKHFNELKNFDALLKTDYGRIQKNIQVEQKKVYDYFSEIFSADL